LLGIKKKLQFLFMSKINGKKRETKENLPIGMQLVARLREEYLLLQASHTFEKMAPWQNKIPSFIIS